MAFRFLHLADLHLASGFGGSAATKAKLRAGILESFGDAMELAIKERVDAVLIAGDFYDEEKLTPRIAARIVDELERVASEDIAVLWVTGNHDPGAPGQRSADWIARDLDGKAGAWRRNVHVFRDVLPERFEVGDKGVVIGAGHPRDRETRNLAASFPLPGELDLKRGQALVGMLHTQVEGAPSEHARYAPSTHADFEARPYSYWALGHVHKRGQAVPGQPAYYAGNLMGRSAKPAECGAKGGYLVTAEPGVPAEPTFIALGRYRWERVVVDTRDRSDPALAAVRGAEHRDGLARALDAYVRAALPHGAATGSLVLRVELAGPFKTWEWLRDGEFVAELGERIGRELGCLELDLRCGSGALGDLSSGSHVFAEVDRSELEESPTVLARALALHRELEQAESLDKALRGLEPRIDLELLDLPSEAPERERYLRSLWRDLDALAIERLLGSVGRQGDGR